MPFDPDAYTAEQRSAWSEAAAAYEAMSLRLFSKFTPEFSLFAEPEGRILDVACGPGLLTVLLGATGVDLAPGMIELARARHPNLTWRVMNAEALEFPDKSFDLVTCQLGLMLFARPDQALSEMARVGRRVACLVQGSAEGMVFSSLLLKTLVRRAPRLKAPPGAPTLFAFGEPGKLVEAFGRAGLTDVVEKRLSGVYEFASAQDYWDTFTRGGGRTARMLASLSAEEQDAVKADVLAEVERRDGKLPWEVVMARGRST